MSRLDDFLLLEKVTKKEIDDAYSNSNIRIGSEFEFRVNIKEEEKRSLEAWSDYHSAIQDYNDYMDQIDEFESGRYDDPPDVPDYVTYYDLGEFKDGTADIPQPPKPETLESFDDPNDVFKFIVSVLPLDELPFKPYISLVSHGSKKISIKSWVFEPDMSVGDDDSVELISPPLTTKEFLSMTPKIFNFINKYGYTDDSCGLHNSISFTNIKNLEVSLDPVKLALFTDEGLIYKYFESRKNNEFAVSLMKALKRGKIDYSAIKELVDVKKLKKKFEYDRHLGINFQNLSENNKYIEFRYIGGSDYHKKWDKVKQIVGNYIWNMSIALDPEYKKKEYINKLIRIIEKTDIDISDDSYYGKKKKWED